MRFVNIKFGYLSECSVTSVALFITLIFISKIKKRTTFKRKIIMSIMDVFNEELKQSDI